MTDPDYFEMARLGTLPADFDQWELLEGGDQWGTPNAGSWTIAHVAAKYGNLPDGFDQWEIADEYKWTVAHEAAVFGKLPDGFDRWEMADDNGDTVAHIAAVWGSLPFDFDFDQFELTNNQGLSVAQTAKNRGILLPERYIKISIDNQ